MAKIMIVDDDSLVTSLLEKLLAIEGHKTIAVNESTLAIEIAKFEKPDLFLLDLMMPQPDGFKLTRMLRLEPTFTKTPIIIVTALDDDDSRAVAFDAGANDYITKPFHPDELAESVLGALGKEAPSTLPPKHTNPLLEATKNKGTAQTKVPTGKLNSRLKAKKFRRTVPKSISQDFMDLLREKTFWLILLIIFVAFYIFLIKVLP